MNHEPSNHEVPLSSAPETNNDDIQRAEDTERARSFIESILQAEPPEDSTVVWQYAVIKAAQAVDRQEYHEAERLYHEAWRALPKEDRDLPRMRCILRPLTSLYRKQSRYTEHDYIQGYSYQAYRQQSQEWRANWPPGPSMLAKHLPPQWPKEVLPFPSVRDFTQFRMPICTRFYNHDMVNEHEETDQGAVLDSLRELWKEIDAYAWYMRRSCHAIKAREHALKAFLVDTEGIKAEWDEEAAELVWAREQAQEELEEYRRLFCTMTDELAALRFLVDTLLRDLPNLSQVDRAKLEQYKDLYQYLAPKCQYYTQKDEEEWEQLPIVEILDIAKAYLPGMRDDEASSDAETKN
jgi:hypothetical protein